MKLWFIENRKLFYFIVFAGLGIVSGLLTFIHPGSIFLFVFLIIGGFLFMRVPEIFIPLYVFSGFYKSVIPGPDITMVFWGLAVLAALMKIYKQREYVLAKFQDFHYIFLALFALWIIFSITYTVADAYAIEKTYKVILLTFGSIILPVALIDNERQFKRVLLVIVSLSTLMGITSIITGERIVFGSNYLALGYISSTAIIILLFYFLPKAKFKWPIILLMIIAVLALVNSAARGSVLFLPIVILLVVIMSNRLFIDKIKIVSNFLIVGVMMITILFVIFPQNFESLFFRLSELENEVVESEGRGNYIKVAMQLISDYPILGVGIGGYGMKMYGVDGREYPHNVFLEIASELGMIGFIFFTLFVLTLCIAFLKKRKLLKNFDNVLFGLFIFGLLTALKSNDLVDNRITFIFMGLMASAIRMERDGCEKDD